MTQRQAEEIQRLKEELLQKDSLLKAFESGCLELFAKDPLLREKLEQSSSFFSSYFKKIRSNTSVTEIADYKEKNTRSYLTSIQNIPLNHNLLSGLEHNPFVKNESHRRKQDPDKSTASQGQFQYNNSIYTNTWKSGKTLLSKVDFFENKSKEDNFAPQKNGIDLKKLTSSLSKNNSKRNTNRNTSRNDQNITDKETAKLDSIKNLNNSNKKVNLSEANKYFTFPINQSNFTNIYDSKLL